MLSYSNKISNKSIFISRDLNEDSLFHKLKEDYNATIIAIPLIKIVQIPFSFTPKTDWIFFTSKNAINFFFAQNPDVSEDTKYGVVSDSTNKELFKHDKKVNFIGEGTDLNKIAKDFREVLQNQSVLFPQAMDSLQTIQKQLAFTNTIYNIYTYKTIIRSDFDIPYTDIAVFTSPSNVTSYFNKYKIDPRQLVIGMGFSTKQKLTEYGVRNVILPIEFSEQGLHDAIINYYNLQ